MYYLCGLAKTLQILNQREYLCTTGLQQAFLKKEVERKSSLLFFNGG